MDITKVAIRASTQQHLDIEDIQDDLVILKDGGACLVIATTAINFNLLSEKEQDATIYAYAGLLNSLTFSIQILMRSQKKDISGYLALLNEAERRENTPKVKEQIQKYRQFISETVQKNEVLDKKFFIVIPMSALELGVTQTLTATFSQKKGLPFEKSYIIQRAKVNLNPKRDYLLRLLARLGLKGRQLNTQELIQLFFNIYNQEAVGQKISSSQEYSTPIMQANLRTPTPEQPTLQAAPEPAPKPEAPPVTIATSPTPPPTAPLPSTPAPTAAPPAEDFTSSIQNQINNLIRQTSQAPVEPASPMPNMSNLNKKANTT